MIEVRALLPDDDRRRFRSGDPDLDRFFLRFAGQNQFRHHIGVTYVAVEGEAIVGFATVAAAHVEATAVPRRLPCYPLPVLRLARLAVSETARGQGIGQLLMRAVLGLAHDMASTVGCIGVMVDAKQGAASFYERLGFVPLSPFGGELGDRPAPRAMFLELGAIPTPGA